MTQELVRNNHQPSALLVCAAAALLLLSGAGLSSATDEVAKIPVFIEGQTATHFAWVSAVEALDAEGNVRHEYFLENDIGRQIEETSAAKRHAEEWISELRNDECTAFRSTQMEKPSANTAREFVQQAHLVLTGRIAAIEPGFSYSTAGSLLKVEVQEVLSQNAEYEIGEYTYVFIPWARFAVHDSQFCQGRFLGSYRLKVGDNVLVLDYGTSSGQPANFVWAAPWEVVFGDADTGALVDNFALDQVLWKNADLQADSSRLLWGDEVTSFASLVRELHHVFGEQTDIVASDR